MSEFKWIEKEFQGHETFDGAGVKLRRIFGGPNSYLSTDPFLLLDHFGSDKPEDYIAGFPWHPHRGIETVTYQLEGKTEHEDSEGNKGVIYPGDLQWMTAGSGIFHKEMPRSINPKNERENLLSTGMPNSVVGMQLWINLTRKNKMSDPVYRYISGSKVPEIDNGLGARVKIVSGEFLRDVGALKLNDERDITYLDVKMTEEAVFDFTVKKDYTSLVYILTGKAIMNSKDIMFNGNAYVFSHSGIKIHIKTEQDKTRFLLLAGKSIREPIAWYGPIVMNTNDELSLSFKELNEGNFIKNKKPSFQDVD